MVVSSLPVFLSGKCSVCRRQSSQRPNCSRSRVTAAALRFVGFTVVVAFTLLNLYVGVIFSQFSKIRNMSTTGSAFLTSKQQVGRRMRVCICVLGNTWEGSMQDCVRNATRRCRCLLSVSPFLLLLPKPKTLP